MQGLFDRKNFGCIHEISSALFHLAQRQSLSLTGAFEWIAENAEECLDFFPIFATKSFALTAVPTTVLLSAKNFDNFSPGVIEAINLEGYKDTIGAMVGAILEARNGIEKYPTVGSTISFPGSRVCFAARPWQPAKKASAGHIFRTLKRS